MFRTLTRIGLAALVAGSMATAAFAQEGKPVKLLVDSSGQIKERN